MSKPMDFTEISVWLQSEVIKMTAAANQAVEDGNMTHDQAMVVHAENVAMITAKALNRTLELLEELGKAQVATEPATLVKE